MTDSKNMHSGNVVWRVYAICLMVIAVIVASNLYLLKVSGGIADVERAAVEGKLINSEIARQKRLLVRDQSQISHWDKTVEAFGDRVNRTFVKEEIVEWLWEDFGIQRTVVVGPDNQSLLSVFEDNLLDPQAGMPIVAATADLIDFAREKYQQRRVKTARGYVFKADPLDRKNPAYLADIRMIDGVLGIVAAQAIVPDTESKLVMPEANILVTFKPFGPQLVSEVGGNLGLKDLRLSVLPQSRPNDIHLMNHIESAVENNKTPLFVTWTPAKPSQQVWARVKMSLLVTLLAVATGLALVSLWFGRTLKALQFSEQNNRFLALHDGLTGLANRLHFDRELEKIIDCNAQDRCAILCVDLDRFKAVNDTYGHQAGDIAIKTTADRISRCVEGIGLVARIGGDEFIILLRDKLDKNYVLMICDQIIESVCQEISFEGGRATVGASIGVAWWPDDALTAKNVIRSADEALYRAKENGRGCARCADEASALAKEGPKPSADQKAA